MILVKNLCNDTKNPLGNPKENKMTKAHKMAKQDEDYMVDDLVYFLDSLMTQCDEKIAKLKENKRKKFILQFFQAIGFIEPAEGELSAYVHVMADNFYDAMARKHLSSKRNYLSLAHNCRPDLEWPQPSKNWDCFATALGTMFSRKQENLFRWLRFFMRSRFICRYLNDRHSNRSV
jgi:hypothetical protein